MKIIFAGLLVATTIPLAACDQNTGEQSADRGKSVADDRADSLKTIAGTLRNQADALDRRADKIRSTDGSAGATQSPSNAIDGQ